METIDNINRTLADDLRNTIKKGSRVSIASACFSIYAFEELKKELKNVESLRFIFTSPSFLEEKIPREKKEFYIPRLTRERNVYGTDFEIKLRNGLKQKAISRECAEWVRKKVEIRSNIANRSMNSMVNIDSNGEKTTYTPVDQFTSEGIGCERGNSISMYSSKYTAEETLNWFGLFNQVWDNKDYLEDVKEEFLDRLTEAYDENSPEFIYFVTLYNIFKEFLEEISDDHLPNEATGFKDTEIWNSLYSFQKDAVLGLINKMELFNGCILADSVGLGKTFTALAVIKYYESRNKNVLVLCPKKLAENWKIYKSNYKNNPLAKDRLRYDLLHHTDLSRKRGESNGIDLKLLNWGNYDLVVIDESHNFRNGKNNDEKDSRINRYTRLLRDVIRPGVKTKVLMLSATPVNNRFYDLYNQLQIAYEGDPALMRNNLKIDKSLSQVFMEAQKTFNAWGKQTSDLRTTENLLNMLGPDFFQVLDSVTIARSRKHIEKYYGLEEVGHFPTRLKPINHSPGITDADLGITFQGINSSLEQTSLSVYTPSEFILPSKREHYGINEKTIGRKGREQGICRLMRINLLKRLESSVSSFRKTLGKVLDLLDQNLEKIERFKNGDLSVKIGGNLPQSDEEDFFEDEKEVMIELADMDYLLWEEGLRQDHHILSELLKLVEKITPDVDLKLRTLKECIYEKVDNPINPGNRKILIFTTFSDTADYLYENLGIELKQNGINVAEITGSAGRSMVKEINNDFNDILTWFSPVSKKRSLLDPDAKEEVDVLIATDCISEGQNLQDCDYCINYDIHWNPVRIIQRFGRVDRIGSKNDVIQLVNFWPDMNLDEYLALKKRVESRMKATVLVATGDDNILNDTDEDDLSYRMDQLERLRNEVVDIEEMQSGISIMDLGLNEFRTDLLEYTRNAGELDGVPPGLHAVVPATEDMPPGVIFVLLNRVDKINHENRNRLHPFYMIFMGVDGSVVCNHLEPKKLLDLMRLACKGKDRIYKDLCASFNNETDDGKNMAALSDLLSKSIDSIIDKKEQSELDDFLDGKDSFSNVKSSGLDDFELICFLVVR